MISNICHLIASREHGGLEKHVADLSRWQAHNTDAQVSVIAHPRYLQTLDEKVQFIPLNTDRSRHHPNLVWRLANYIRKGEYQITHGHGSKSAQLLAAVKPYTESLQVITRHNVRHPRDKLASNFDARIAISEGTVANSKLNWNIIPNGVELRAAAASSTVVDGSAENQPVLLVTGRLIKGRGVDCLLAALADLPRIQLVILGDGPEKNTLQKQAQTLGISQRVSFFSATNALAEFLQAADLVVIPALGEGAPYTMIESLLHRRPVLSTPAGNAVEYLPQRYILEDPTAQGLAQKIAWILDNRQQMERDFAPLYQRASDELTLDSMARATWQVYTQLIA